MLEDFAREGLFYATEDEDTGLYIPDWDAIAKTEWEPPVPTDDGNVEDAPEVEGYTADAAGVIPALAGWVG